MVPATTAACNSGYGDPPREAAPHPRPPQGAAGERRAAGAPARHAPRQAYALPGLRQHRDRRLRRGVAARSGLAPGAIPGAARVRDLAEWAGTAESADDPARPR